MRRFKGAIFSSAFFILFFHALNPNNSYVKAHILNQEPNSLTVTATVPPRIQDFSYSLEEIPTQIDTQIVIKATFQALPTAYYTTLNNITLNWQTIYGNSISFSHSSNSLQFKPYIITDNKLFYQNIMLDPNDKKFIAYLYFSKDKELLNMYKDFLIIKLNIENNYIQLPEKSITIFLNTYMRFTDKENELSSLEYLNIKNINKTMGI